MRKTLLSVVIQARSSEKIYASRIRNAFTTESLQKQMLLEKRRVRSLESGRRLRQV